MHDSMKDINSLLILIELFLFEFNLINIEHSQPPWPSYALTLIGMGFKIGPS